MAKPPLAQKITGSPVRFEGLSKTYGPVTAVQPMDLDVRAGEFLSFLGPSGSGKTTTLMMLAGFESPSTGRIVVGDIDITAMPPAKRNIGMVFQNYALFPHMTVEQNVAFPLRMRGIPASEQAKMVGEMLGTVGLGDFRARFPAQLSGGQQQRVALARAIVFKPPVLLMDEPLSALDKYLRSRLQIEIKRIQRDLGITVVYVTHDQDEAMTMSDRIAVMDAGVVKQIGTPAEVYEAPDSRYVADFIGSVNLFEGKVKECAKGMVTLESPDGFSSIEAAEDRTFAPGQELWLAIRPEKMTLSRERPKEANAASGEAWEIAYMGDVTNYIVKLDGGKMVRASTINRQRSVENPIGYDERIWVSFEPDGGSLLDK